MLKKFIYVKELFYGYKSVTIPIGIKLGYFIENTKHLSI